MANHAITPVYNDLKLISSRDLGKEASARRQWKALHARLESGEEDCSHLSQDFRTSLNYDVDYALFDQRIRIPSQRRVFSNKQTGVSFTHEFRLWIHKMQKGLCGYCGKRLRLHDDCCASVDHMAPRSRGGADIPPNLLLACWECNSGKRHKTVEEFRHMIMTKQSPAYGLITRRQIADLQAAGIDMQMPKWHIFAFEFLAWAHVNSEAVTLGEVN